MPVNLEWDVAHRLVAPRGELILNDVGNLLLASGSAPLYLITPPYSIVPALRPVSDSLSQADGSSLQPPFIGGMVATLKVGYWVVPLGGDSRTDRSFACGADLREMDERLMLLLNDLREYGTDPAGTQRLEWTPTDAADRCLTDVLVAAWPAPGFQGGDQGGAGADVTFAIATPLPYAVSAAPTSTDIATGDSALVTNNGTAEQSPVIRAHGPTSAFAVTNERTAEALSYDSSRPGAVAIGGGDYAEIDFFKGSILLNGDPDQDLIAGLDPSVVDFFHLLPGDQTLDAAGADITVISNDAWA